MDVRAQRSGRRACRPSCRRPRRSSRRLWRRSLSLGVSGHWLSTMSRDGEDPGHRSHRIHRLARRSRARGAGRRPSPAHPAKEQGRHPLGPRVRAGDRRRHRPACRAARDGRRRTGLPRRGAHLAADPGSRRGLGHERARNASRLGVSARGRGRARRPDLFRGRGGRRQEAEAGRRGSHLRHRPPRDHLCELEARGRGRGASACRPRIARHDRQPVFRPRSRRDRAGARWTWSSASSRRRFRHTWTAASTSSTSATWRKGTSWRTRRARSAGATSSPAATSRSTACSPTSARISGVDSPRLKLPGSALLRCSSGRSPAVAGVDANFPRRDPLGHALVVLPEHPREVGARVQGAPARGDAPGRRQLAASPDRGGGS